MDQKDFGNEEDGDLELPIVPFHINPKHEINRNAPFPFLNMFPDRPNPNRGTPITFSTKKLYTAPEIIITGDGTICKNLGNYRTTLTNFGTSSGTYYYEIKILDLGTEGNVRVGISQISSCKQGPLGLDGFGYSLRMNKPTLFHRSRPYDVLCDDVKEGDVIGVLLHLPEVGEALTKELKFRLWDPTYLYRQYSYEKKSNLPSKLNPIKLDYPYPLPPPQPHPHQPHYNFTDPFLPFDQLPIAPGSSLIFYHNGKKIKDGFLNLILGKYYPAVSLFNGAKVQINPGPQFEFPMKEGFFQPNLHFNDLKLDQLGCPNIDGEIEPFNNLMELEEDIDH